MGELDEMTEANRAAHKARGEQIPEQQPGESDEQYRIRLAGGTHHGERSGDAPGLRAARLGGK